MVWSEDLEKEEDQLCRFQLPTDLFSLLTDSSMAAFSVKVAIARLPSRYGVLVSASRRIFLTSAARYMPTS